MSPYVQALSQMFGKMLFLGLQIQEVYGHGAWS